MDNFYVNLSPLASGRMRLAVRTLASASPSPRLFWRFEPADSSGTRCYGGPGPGLSICASWPISCRDRSIAWAHRGARLIVVGRFADADGASDPFGPRRPECGERRPARRSANLVANHAVILQAVALILTSAGSTTARTNDGAAAVRVFKMGGHDLILMDMQMTALDGCPTCAKSGAGSNRPAKRRRRS